MFFHKHPYAPFIPPNARKLIVGTLPPPRFSLQDLKEGDVNFCYGSRDGLLWPVLDRIFGLNLIYANTKEAISQRKNFLEEHDIGICDIVESCYRKKIDASDLGMEKVTLRNLLFYLRGYSTIDTILFTGGNSKNGPEYFFRKHLKENGSRLEPVDTEVPRIHRFVLESDHRKAVKRESLQDKKRYITTISLTAPSGSANRAIGSIPLYKHLKKKDTTFSTIDFRVMQYEPFFRN
ncbi:uracil-DNA glycosylase family protein [Ascidiimonas aurantiaca]|uniref:uracil-DNA glycosylase family protein n=1 Tax=Ascidiimonas aurantiaca TaxID=1685432 RepID=UPI0030ECA7EF